jgi:hypothetical protein
LIAEPNLCRKVTAPGLAVRRAVLHLTDTEALVLDELPATMLGEAIDRLCPADRDRRQLLQVVAASFVSVAAGTAGGPGCTIDGYRVPDDGHWRDARVPHDIESLSCDGIVPDIPEIPDVLPLDDARPTSDASVDASVEDAAVIQDASLPDAGQQAQGDAAVTPHDSSTDGGP